MADAKTPEKKDEAEPPRQPAGPGLMMVLGLALLVVAVWCANDFFFRGEDWAKAGHSSWIWFNGGGMLVCVGASVYCFIQAYLRNKKAGTSGAKKPDDPNLP